MDPLARRSDPLCALHLVAGCNGLEEMAAAFDPQVRVLASRTRNLIVDVYAEVVEVPWPRQNVAGYGIGPKKMSEHFSTSPSTRTT